MLPLPGPDPDRDDAVADRTHGDSALGELSAIAPPDAVADRTDGDTALGELTSIAPPDVVADPLDVVADPLDVVADPLDPADPADPSAPTDLDAPEPVLLLEPRDGLPPVVVDAEALARTVAAFAGGDGPVAIDAERASGYRYGQRAFLVQLRRAGAGTALVDPTGVPDLSSLGDAIGAAEWVLHAASQDLACLAEVGLVPSRLFDTELAGRLLGYPRVGLGPLTERVLGLRLEKGHSAADWSIRPLPEPWLRYAALDVEVLVELRDALAAELEASGKLPWALEEFAHLAAAAPAEPRVDPWRRTSGLHRVRGRRGLAVVRELWNERDELARRRDVSPGRVLPDTAIVEAALAAPTTTEALGALPVFRGRSQRREVTRWHAAVARGLALPEQALPPATLRYDGPPPARAWAERDPAAAARLSAARDAVTAIAEEHRLPVENLLSPETLRRIAWEPPEPATAETVGAAMRALSARPWQVELTAATVAEAFARAVAGA